MHYARRVNAGRLTINMAAAALENTGPAEYARREYE